MCTSPWYRLSCYLISLLKEKTGIESVGGREQGRGQAKRGYGGEVVKEGKK